ncbi:MFS transporter [Streptomyces hiroshimensis]|uniref:MFS transporter n=1 Tax=Streptomyces hiroshimensis TaxID=66424 RepID=A0ABQ2Y5U0_9ACTN|nr:MFS transporter [Streptomyces hiroshimensis]GGX64805.1 MFS transporter [Streptomyces hiroshimensis]
MTQIQDRSPSLLAHWDPEDERFWRETGSRVARRNLVVSIVNEHIGFSVFTMWSVLVLFLGPDAGFSFSASDKFLLISTPTAVGALMRLPYGYLVTRFGGRNWTVFAGLILLVPTVLAAVFVRLPGTPLWVFVLVAATAGLGGGNFASSMCNIHAFYPRHRQGWALGLNAGGGNLGVATAQLAGLAVLATAGAAHPVYLISLYMPLLVLAAIAAALWMDNLPTLRHQGSAQRAALRDKHTWMLSLLYVTTFGSFIGYGFAFGLVLQAQFGFTALQAASLTFLGPLLGSLARPFGGRWADRWGGARVTLWMLLAMTVGTAFLYVATEVSSSLAFIIASTVLIVFAGIGNGSTYRMIPEVFARRADDGAGSPAQASSAVIAIAGAVGALGGVLINLAFKFSFGAAGSAGPAVAGFVVFYAVCVLVVRAVYLRKDRPAAADRTHPEPA